jgi:arylsulfatase A-like enzyme
MNKPFSAILLPFVSVNLLSAKEPVKKQPNVLFIIVDDLRPELGCYGKSHIKSPNMDAFAAQGVLFQNNYCNVSVSGASRACLFTGLYPNRDHFVVAATHVDKDAPGITTLPQLFKENGYTTISYGKVFHIPDDAIQSWTETPWHPQYKDDFSYNGPWADYQSPENLNKDNITGPAWEKADVSDSAYHTGRIAQRAISRLHQLANEKKPFFMAVGLIKPHLPFNAPSKYWDMYDEKEIQLAPNPFMPQNAPKEARFTSPELRSYCNIPKKDTLVNDETARMLKHGYLACVSYSDAMVGKVLDELKKTGLDKNTIVVLLGDNGYSLGEHTHWVKHTCFYNSFHTPLIIKAPGLKPAKTEAVVSYVDIYPTICDMANIAKPAHLQGKSEIDILKNPKTKGGVALCRFVDGESIVTDKYGYTEYYNLKSRKYLSRMLYDHKKDSHENVNVAEKQEYAPIVAELSKQLRAHVEKVNKK